MVAAHPLIAALFLLHLAAGAVAHPFHASYAEVEWSPDRDRLQVALRVIPEDLETALSRVAGQPVVLDPGALPRSLIERYLDAHFRLRTGTGDAPGAELIGAEVAHDATWLYFTLAVRPEDGPFLLQNTVLMDVGAGQTNRLRRLWAPTAPLLVFTAREPRQPLPVNEASVAAPTQEETQRETHAH